MLTALEELSGSRHGNMERTTTSETNIFLRPRLGNVGMGKRNGIFICRRVSLGGLPA